MPPLVITAVKVSAAALHIVPCAALMVMVGVTLATVIVIAFEVAVAGEAHDELEVITQVTTAPLVSVVLVNVALLVPAFTPFTFHWYDGVLPPLVGVAVNVTAEPGQKLVDGVVMLTAGVTAPLTVIVIALEVAVAGDAQVAVEVITQVTTAPLVNVVVV